MKRPKLEPEAVVTSHSHIEGGLLALTSLGIVGWARDIDAPERTVHVVLLVNDIATDAALSNRFDLEIIRLRVGPGIPGFTMNVRRPQASEYPLRLSLREMKGAIIGSPMIISSESELSQFAEPEKAQYEGMVDGIQDGVLLGWARSLTDPDTAIAVELHDGSERIGRQVAQSYRADLAASGKRNGWCAFSFELPISLLDGKTHSLQVSIAGTAIVLQNSPLQIGPTAASELVKEIASLRSEVARLRKLVDIVVAPDGRLQTEIIRTLNERVAAIAEIQRDAVERELDALRSATFRPAKVSGPATRTKKPQTRP